MQNDTTVLFISQLEDEILSAMDDQIARGDLQGVIEVVLKKAYLKGVKDAKTN